MDLLEVAKHKPKTNSYLQYIYCEQLNTNLNLVLSKDLNKELIREKEARLNDLFAPVTRENSTIHEFIEIFKDQSRDYLYSHLNYDDLKWFNRMTSIVENLPLCVTIANAKKNIMGFPLLYVNKQFEKMTGYNREDIIGKNCNFLQPDEPPRKEELQYVLMKNSLEVSKPVSVVITNYKSNGVPFKNLLALKPICDRYGNYIFVIGIQTEITDELNLTDIKNVIDLIDILQFEL
uniref:PAS domain-containing protein n=1 Tax=viral metagenome TaxID=1070528 RepID=A0A6C0BWQ9_9ZZZZ